jgi:flagellar biosynthesis/type III secretory pathway protein FliH
LALGIGLVKRVTPQAMVYHVRVKAEQEPLVEFIRETARSKSREAEVRTMGQTMAEFLVEKGKAEGKLQGKIEGKLEGKREFLLSLLREKFKKVSSKIDPLVRATKDEAKLDTWSKEVLWADSLQDMSFFKKV